MNWLFPSVVAALSSTLLLLFLFVHLYRQEHGKAIGAWAVAWALYSSRFVFLLLILRFGSGAPLLIGNQLSAWFFSLPLLWGTYLWMDRSMPKGWFFLFLAGGVFIVTGIVLQFTLFSITLPTFLFLGAVTCWTGFMILRHCEVLSAGAKITGWALILWGLHKFNYPFLRSVEAFAPWGFLLGSLFGLATAVGMLLLHFDRAKRQLARQLQFEQAVAETSNRLLSVEEDSDSAVTNALEPLLEASGASRVYIFHNFDDPNDGLCMQQIYEICAPGIAPEIDNRALQHVVYAEGFERWRQVHSAGEAIRGHVCDFPDTEREILEPQGILSLLALPVRVAGAWWGFIVFVETRQRRDWRDSEVALLGTAAEMLGAYFTRKHIHERLERVASELKLAQSISKIGNWSFDPMVGIAKWSEEIYRIYERDPALGPIPLADYPKFYSPEYLEQFQNALSAAIENGTPYEIELYLTLPSGSEKWVHAICRPSSEKGPAGHCLLGTIQDVTDRKQADAALKQQHTMLARTEAVAHVGSWKWEVRGDNAFWSDELFRIFGFEPAAEAPSFAKQRDLYAPEDYSRLAQAVEACAKKGVPYDLELRIVRPDGEMRHCIVRGVPDRDADGVVRRLYGSLQDITSLKHAEERITVLSRMLDEASASITIHDTEGHFVFANAATAALHGYANVQEYMQVNLHDLDVPESEAVIGERLQKIAETGEARFEVEHYRKDGSTFPLSVLAKRIEWEGKSAVLSIAADITERRKAEEALRESEQRLSLATRSAALGIWDWDIVHNDMTWDDQMFRLYGVEDRPETYGVEIWANGLHPDDRDFAWEACQAALRGEKEYNIEFRVCWPDGTIRYIKGYGMVLRDDAGKPARMLGINFDITATKEAEFALRASERRNQALLDHSPACHKIVDLDLRLQYMSKSGFQMLKLKETSDVYGRPYPFDFFPADFREGMQQALERVIEKGEGVTFEGLASNSEGNDAWLHSTLVPVRDEDGALGYITVVTADLTQQKRLENDLHQAQKMESVGRLAGGVAHDFNNMLNVILGHAEMLLDDLQPDSQIRTDLEEIRKAAERSANLTRQLLAFARRQTVAPKTLDLNETIASMLKMLARLIGEDIDLLWKPGGRLDLVRIDPGQVDQILANLAVNARDAIGHQNGKLTIETSNVCLDEAYCNDHAGFKPGRYVKLGVSDDGCGMDEQTRAQIFEPFFTTKGVGEGTGLGLATIYGIVKQNNGFINVYSEPDTGSTFSIYLPAIEAKSPREGDAGASGASPVGGNETILVVEDEAAILKLARAMLERLGYSVLTALNPREAIEIAQAQSGKIDLVITDVVMPEMNGRDLIDHIRDIYPETRCLFMSGYTANVIAHQGVLDASVHFIQKPFAPRDLASKVREVIDG